MLKAFKAANFVREYTVITRGIPDFIHRCTRKKKHRVNLSTFREKNDLFEKGDEITGH
jgi:hypothetical protein